MKRAQLIPSSVVLSVGLLCGSALAQAGPDAADSEPAAPWPAAPPVPAPPPTDLPPPPQGKVVIAAPAVPAATPRAGYHVHDGFYLRLAAGVGGGQGSVSSEGPNASDSGVGGLGLALNLWIGGTPGRGIALGGLVSFQGINGDASDEPGSDLAVEGGVLMIGPFVDAFPDPQRGLHVGGSLGLAGFSAEEAAPHDGLRYSYNGGGFGASAWVGYMGFVGPEWSLGGLLQLAGFATSEEGDGENASGYTLSASLSVLCH